MKRNLILKQDIGITENAVFDFNDDNSLFESHFYIGDVRFEIAIDKYNAKSAINSGLFKKEPKKQKQDIAGFVEWCASRDWVYFKDQNKWKNYHSQDWKTTNDLIDLFHGEK